VSFAFADARPAYISQKFSSEAACCCGGIDFPQEKQRAAMVGAFKNRFGPQNQNHPHSGWFALAL